MANLIRRPTWQLVKPRITPEEAFLNRRHFCRQLGWVTAAAAVKYLGPSPVSAAEPANRKVFPAPRNPEFNPGWRLTNESTAANYNNFYEFSLDKEGVAPRAQKLVTEPWPIEIGGLVEKPVTLDARDIAEWAAMEERVYRFRCVEAWAMVVPWSGFPFSKVIEKVVPKPEARFVRFQTFLRPEQAPNFRLSQYPWPYVEGLRLDEAKHPLTLLAFGIYGKPLPKQHGAPLRMVVPWKYGYKSIKSIVKIEFVREQPPTFWERLLPDEYPFESNVNPKVPHPRWSQATERLIDTGDRVRTQLYNGYGAKVASLYETKSKP